MLVEQDINFCEFFLHGMPLIENLIENEEGGVKYTWEAVP